MCLRESSDGADPFISATAIQLTLKLYYNSTLRVSAYSKRVPALIVHSALKSVHPGFPGAFIF